MMIAGNSDRRWVWMRRLFTWLVVLSVLGALAWTLYFLYEKSQVRPVVWKTVQPQVRDVIEKTVATGAIVPRREVLIKPRVSGVLSKLHVEPGQIVEAGSLIAEIKILPNVVSVGSAEARVASAGISLKSAERERERMSGLLAERLISQGEFNRAETDHQLAVQELAAANDNLALIKDGAIRGSRKVSNEVRATVAGMVIEVPVKEGATVIEANTFNEGTTVASVADMQDLIFKGNVDESEVGKLQVGMPVTIWVGALDSHRFAGSLQYLSPKGIEKEGTIEFEVRAAVKLQSGVFIRANYSATADIILRRRQQVLTLEESVITFPANSVATAATQSGAAAPELSAAPSAAPSGAASSAAPSGAAPSASLAPRAEPPVLPRLGRIEVEVAPQIFEPRDITLGLSDGIFSEVLSGLRADERVKVPSDAAQP